MSSLIWFFRDSLSVFWILEVFFSGIAGVRGTFSLAAGSRGRGKVSFRSFSGLDLSKGSWFS